MDDPLWKLDSYSLKPLTPPPHFTIEANEINYQDYSLVITGDVFRWMVNYAPLETLQRVRITISHCFFCVLMSFTDAGKSPNICQNVAR